MKTIYSKFLAVLAIAFALTASVVAQEIGDYRSKQSGAWYGNAVGTAIIESGVITGINLTSGGQGYTTAPAITIQNGGGTTTATASITNGVVTGTTITSGGSGCSVASTAIVFAAPTVVADQAANWETYDGTSWVQATALPAATNNVTIRSGHTITISSGGNATCKNLTVEAGATLNSPNYAGNYVTTLALYGNIVNNGVIGNTESTRSIGDGIRAYQNATGTSTISGTGVTNIGSFQVGGNISTDQNIIIAQSMELRRSNTGSGGSINLGIQAGTMGTATKTLTINPGCTVKITNGGLHAGQNAAVTAISATSGNIAYNVEGTLDCSLGQFNLYNTTNTGSASQSLTVNVKNGGKLMLGSRIQLYTALAGQTCAIVPETGSTVEFAGSTAPAFSLTTGTGTTPTLPTSYWNLVNSNTIAAGVTLPASTVVKNNLTVADGTTFGVTGTLLNLGTITGTVASGNVVNVSSVDVAKGTVSGTVSGNEVTLTASPVDGNHFVNWTDGINEVSAASPYVFTATANQTLVGNFSINTAVSKNEKSALLIVDGRNLKFSADVLSTELYNGLGQLIMSNNNASSIAVANKGVYILKMLTLEGVKTQKLMLK